MSRLRERQFRDVPDEAFWQRKTAVAYSTVQEAVRRKEKINYVVFTLIILFTISSWIDMVGVFAELPLMVPVLPEGWNLGVYFCLAIEIPFIAPVVIFVLTFVKPKVVKYPVVIVVIIVTGAVSLALLAKFWSTTVVISGHPRSVPLLVLVTFLGLVDSCSSVAFYPYMKSFHPTYLLAVLVGESVTGFIPAIMKLVQGGAEPYCANVTSSSNHTEVAELYTEPRYSISIYFAILSAIMGVCFIAFLLIELHPRLRAVKLAHTQSVKPYSADDDFIQRRKLSKIEYFDYMGIMVITGFVLWGLTSAFYTFSVLPFGFRTMNNAVIIVNSIRFSAACLAYKYPMQNTCGINLIMAVLILPCLYMMACAIYSPCPPLVDTVLGAVLSAGCLVSIDYVSNYMRSCIMKRVSLHGGHVLIVTAMASKTGVMMGAVVSTILIHKTSLFRARQFCVPLAEQCLGFRARFLPRNNR